MIRQANLSSLLLSLALSCASAASGRHSRPTKISAAKCLMGISPVLVAKGPSMASRERQLPPRRGFGPDHESDFLPPFSGTIHMRTLWLSRLLLLTVSVLTGSQPLVQL